MLVHRLINGYLRYKKLVRNDAPEFLLRDCLEVCGAMELCPEFIIEMDVVFNEFIVVATQQATEKAERDKESKRQIQEAKNRAKSRRGKLGRR